MMRSVIPVQKSSLVYVIGAMSVFGTIGVFVKASGQSAFNIVFFRCFFACICLGLFTVCTNRVKKEYFRPGIILPLTASGVALAFNWVFLFKAFELTSITTGIIFYYTQPFILILAGFLLLKEKIESYHIVWTAVAFAGLILSTGVLSDGMAVDHIAKGAIYGMAAAALYAAVVMIAKYYQDVPPVFIVFIQTSVGMVFLFPFTGMSDVLVMGKHWFFLVSLGVVHTAAAYLFFYKGVQALDTAVIAVLGFIDPVVAVFSDILFFDQQIGLVQSAGIAMILFGGFATQMGVDLGVVKGYLNRLAQSDGEDQA